MKINDTVIIKDDKELALLREKSEDVKLPLSKDDEDLVLSMIQYVKDSTIEEIAKKQNLKPAVGISAIQIGIKKKIFVVVLRDENEQIIHEYALINPKIISESIQLSYLKYGEGCLSVENKHEGYVYRHARIKIKAYNFFTKKEEIIKAHGYLAIVMQHEYDHLNGILYYDHISKNAPFIEKPNSICIE